uniref:UDP glucuronosyltransferase 5 family, polypeptide D1 n=1 Tax=Neolamprologus brichardi TaxID=32507 RepID=A0A3Q4H9C6_NEOBR
MVKRLRDSQYDLVLTDPALAPGVILAKYLKLPLVLNVRWITSGEGHFVLAPSPLSYIPVPGSGLTDKMNFIQRIKNILFYSIILFQQKFVVDPVYDDMCDKYIEGGCDVISLLQGADIWLFRSDFVFEFPRPTMPNVVYIGGFQCKPAQPLPAELEEFVQSMPWYSYYSLDVLFILLSVVTVLLYSILVLVRFLCCRRRRKAKTKQS